MEKKNCGKSVAIPTVYVVETSQIQESSRGAKELIKYEIYDDTTGEMIMLTDELGNLVLTDNIAKVIGKHYKKLGLQKEDRARIRQINNQFWIASQYNELNIAKQEQKNKTNVSEISQTLDLERENIVLNLGIEDKNIENMKKLDVTDPVLYNLLLKDGKQLDETYIVKEKGQENYRVLSKDKDGNYHEIDSIKDNTLEKGTGKVKDRNNPEAPGKTVGIINRYNMSMGDKTLDLVIYDDGNGNIKAGVIDKDDKENNIIELRDNSARTLDAEVEYIKNDLKDGSIDNSKNREYMKLDIKDPLTEKIENAMKELQDDGVMWSDLKPEELQKVKEIASNKEDVNIDDIKDIIEGEIGQERMPGNNYN